MLATGSHGRALSPGLNCTLDTLLATRPWECRNHYFYLSNLPSCSLSLSMKDMEGSKESLQGAGTLEYIKNALGQAEWNRRSEKFLNTHAVALFISAINLFIGPVVPFGASPSPLCGIQGPCGLPC